MTYQNAQLPGAALSAEQELTAVTHDGHGSLLALALLSLMVGVAAGLAGAFFRLSLEQADHFRDVLITWAHGEQRIGWLLVMASCAGATAAAAWRVRRYAPHAS